MGYPRCAYPDPTELRDIGAGRGAGRARIGPRSSPAAFAFPLPGAPERDARLREMSPLLACLTSIDGRVLRRLVTLPSAISCQKLSWWLIVPLLGEACSDLVCTRW